MYKKSEFKILDKKPQQKKSANSKIGAMSKNPNIKHINNSA
jgi:hypothetical protein